MKYLSMIPAFIRYSFQKEAAFRFNFAINLLNTVLGLAGSLGGSLVVFTGRGEVNGWNLNGVVTVTGVYMLVQALKELAAGPSLSSLSGLGGELWTGQFDYTLLKPLPAQFQVSFRNWNLWSLINIAVASLVIALSVSENGGIIPVNLLAFLVSLLVSMLLVYAILLILAAAGFWYLGTPLMWIFESLVQTGRFPAGIYPGALRLVLTWIVPVGFIMTVPAEILTGRVDVSYLAPGALLAVFLFTAASLFFKASLKKYTGASG